MKINRPIILGIVSFFVFVFSAFYITYPLLFHLGDRVTGYGDEIVIAWIQNWVIHALMINPFSLFEANLYYPYHNTLAFSETFITSSILAIPVRMIIGQPIATENFTLIKSLAILGFSVYLLAYYLTKDFFVSLLVGILVVFSPAVLSNYTHLQILDIGWVVLAMLFFIIFLQSKKTLYLGISFFFFLFQIYNAILPGYFLLFFYVISFIIYLLVKKEKKTDFITKTNVASVIILCLLLIPLAIPYFSVSQEFHYVRDFRDTIHFALQPEDLLYPGSTTRLQPILSQYVPTNHYSQNSEFKPGYLGLAFSLLTLVSFAYFVENFKKRNLFLTIFIFVALTGLLLSFGPFLHLNRHTIHKPFPVPLPYAIFYYVIPGFNGIRNSQMWEMFFIVCMAPAIAIILKLMLHNVKIVKRILIFTMLFILIIGEFNGPLPLVTIPQISNFPKVYSWLAITPEKSSYIVLPIYNWNMSPFTQQELWREYYATIEFRKSVNGYTGFSPPPWQDFIYGMHKNFPKKQSITVLQTMGVHYIIVDTTSFDSEYKVHTEKYNGNMIVSALNKNREVTFVKSIDKYAVFVIDAKK